DRCRTHRRQVAARRDPPGRAAALPADPDDHVGCPVRGGAPDAGLGRGRRTAPTARPGDFRRPDREPDADAVHDAGDLFGVRFVGAALGQEAPPPGHARGSGMNLSEPFVRRPVATVLLTIGIALAGIAAFFMLAVAPLPQVDFPVITVSANLPGASPDTMATSVATPLERRLGVIAGV